MITLTYAHLINQRFLQTFNNLCNMPLPTEVSFNLAKIKKKIQAEGKRAQDSLALINQKHIVNDGQFLEMEKDEAGAPIPGKFVYKEGFSEATQRADLTEMFQIQFNINARPLKISELEKTRQGDEIGISADELLAIEPLLDVTEGIDLEDFVEEAFVPKDLSLAVESGT